MPAEPFSLANLVFLDSEIAMIFIIKGKSSMGNTILDLSRTSQYNWAVVSWFILKEKSKSLGFAILGLPMEVQTDIQEIFEVGWNFKYDLDIWDPLACKSLHWELI